MFSGIVEEKGRISNVVSFEDSIELSISCPTILKDTKIGDSISVNGVCLTVKEIVDSNTFKVDVVKETLSVTSLGDIKNNDVNLERSLRYGDRVGGHFVQGHVDCLGLVKSINKTSEWTEIEIGISDKVKKYCIHKGSVAVDGVSLTIATLTDCGIKIALIPHTLEKTILSGYEIGTSVNIETDMVGKYIENFSGLE